MQALASWLKTADSAIERATLLDQSAARIDNVNLARAALLALQVDWWHKARPSSNIRIVGSGASALVRYGWSRLKLAGVVGLPAPVTAPARSPAEAFLPLERLVSTKDLAGFRRSLVNPASFRHWFGHLRGAPVVDNEVFTNVVLGELLDNIAEHAFPAARPDSERLALFGVERVRSADGDFIDLVLADNGHGFAGSAACRGQAPDHAVTDAISGKFRTARAGLDDTRQSGLRVVADTAVLYGGRVTALSVWQGGVVTSDGMKIANPPVQVGGTLVWVRLDATVRPEGPAKRYWPAQASHWPDPAHVKRLPMCELGALDQSDRLQSIQRIVRETPAKRGWSVFDLEGASWSKNEFAALQSALARKRLGPHRFMLANVPSASWTHLVPSGAWPPPWFDVYRQSPSRGVDIADAERARRISVATWFGDGVEGWGVRLSGVYRRRVEHSPPVRGWLTVRGLWRPENAEALDQVLRELLSRVACFSTPNVLLAVNPVGWQLATALVERWLDDPRPRAVSFRELFQGGVVLSGLRVLLVIDVVSSGHNVRELSDLVRSRGGEAVGLLAVVDGKAARPREAVVALPLQAIAGIVLPPAPRTAKYTEIDAQANEPDAQGDSGQAEASAELSRRFLIAAEYASAVRVRHLRTTSHSDVQLDVATAYSALGADLIERLREMADGATPCEDYPLDARPVVARLTATQAADRRASSPKKLLVIPIVWSGATAERAVSLAGTEDGGIVLAALVERDTGASLRRLSATRKVERAEAVVRLAGEAWSHGNCPRCRLAAEVRDICRGHGGLSLRFFQDAVEEMCVVPVPAPDSAAQEPDHALLGLKTRGGRYAWLVHQFRHAHQAGAWTHLLDELARERDAVLAREHLALLLRHTAERAEADPGWLGALRSGLGVLFKARSQEYLAAEAQRHARPEGDATAQALLARSLLLQLMLATLYSPPILVDAVMDVLASLPAPAIEDYRAFGVWYVLLRRHRDSGGGRTDDWLTKLGRADLSHAARCAHAALGGLLRPGTAGRTDTGRQLQLIGTHLLGLGQARHATWWEGLDASKDLMLNSADAGERALARERVSQTFEALVDADAGARRNLDQPFLDEPDIAELRQLASLPLEAFDVERGAIERDNVLRLQLVVEATASGGRISECFGCRLTFQVGSLLSALKDQVDESKLNIGELGGARQLLVPTWLSPNTIVFDVLSNAKTYGRGVQDVTVTCNESSVDVTVSDERGEATAEMIAWHRDHLRAIGGDIRTVMMEQGRTGVTLSLPRMK